MVICDEIEDLKSFAIHLPQVSTSKKDQRVFLHCRLTYGRSDTEECSTTHQSYVVTIAKIEGLFPSLEQVGDNINN